MVIVTRRPPFAGSSRTTVSAVSVTPGRSLICADNLVAHPGLLWMLATEPAGRTTALVVPDPEGDLREDRGRLIPAAHGTVRFAGALTVAPADLPVVEMVVERAAGVDACCAGLLPVATRVRLLHAERVHRPGRLAVARAAVAAIDEDRRALRLAVKEKDDFFTTYAVSTWSPLRHPVVRPPRLTPSGVTAVSVLFAVAAALRSGRRPGPP